MPKQSRGTRTNGLKNGCGSARRQEILHLDHVGCMPVHAIPTHDMRLLNSWCVYIRYLALHEGNH